MSEEERKWCETNEIPPEFTELFHYLDKRIWRHRIIIIVLLGIIAVLLFK